MTFYPIKRYLPQASSIGYGCMGLGGDWSSPEVNTTAISQAETVLEHCFIHGIRFFDHADIYKQGCAESVFGHWLKQFPQRRTDIAIQTKCGIRLKTEHNIVKRYDFSSSWIKHSIDQSLRRLNTDYVDILMLHRPDPIANWQQTGRALSDLRDQGLIKYIGASNMSPMQIELLKNHTDVELISCQMELSLGHTDFIEQYINYNHQAAPNSFPQGLIEYLQMNDIQLQSWGSLAQGYFSNLLMDSDALIKERDRTTKQLLELLIEKYQVPVEAILLRWLQMFTGSIQTMIGTTQTQRITDALLADTIDLTAEDWYLLFETVRREEIP